MMKTIVLIITVIMMTAMMMIMTRKKKTIPTPIIMTRTKLSPNYPYCRIRMY
ncbi:hypothetical protein [Chryseobacterium sp.]|uniref:hypothetical protein n=1 Tax=Chryseobacterium sp. TaxID=1871047 RepID=UPI0028A09F6B|nr:hypothetical protein [Chryseobacterium sp.]